MEAKPKSDVQPTKKEVQQLTASSTTSSPSHEFSFTISLNIPPTKSSPPPFAATVDLSPADEIFFHGHLLPLHLLSSHPISADSSRSSTNSLESCTFTLKDELLYYHDHDIVHGDDDVIITDDHENTTDRVNLHGNKSVRGKSRSFSHLFFKWTKYHHHESHEDDDDDEHKRKTRKSKMEIVKRYMRLVKPFIPFRHKRVAGSAKDFLRQPASSFNSYSGSLRVMRAGRRSEFSSAPVSIATSPSNSGLLVGTASGRITPTGKNNDGTMDELKSAIQAAIAHCKNSIAEEEEEEEVAHGKN